MADDQNNQDNQTPGISPNQPNPQPTPAPENQPQQTPSPAQPAPTSAPATPANTPPAAPVSPAKPETPQPNPNPATQQTPPQPTTQPQTPPIQIKTPAQQQTSQQTQQVKPPATPINKKVKSGSNKKIITSLLSAFGCGFILFVIMIILGIQQIGLDSNPIAQALGIDANTFVNILVILVNLVFGFVSFASFIAALIGVFKASNARKDDKKAKSKGLLVALISGIIFIITLLTWFGTYSYLSAKRTASTTNQATGIVTDPAVTVELTAPVTIEFDATQIPFDNRRYRVLSINWDFGDGSKGTGSKISHEYVNKGETGRYTATLSVTKQEIRSGEESTDTYTQEIFIANEKVNASFTATPEEGPAPLEVEFDASESKDPDGQIVSWEWDFDNDGQFEEEGEKVTHTFEKLGDYPVTLRVIDNNQEFDLLEKTISVAETDAPVAVIEVDPKTEDFEVGTIYTFKGEESSSPNGRITKYAWDFGDGSPQATTRTATHSFEEGGKYTITLSVTDEDDEIGETTLEIEVEGDKIAPKAQISTTPAPLKTTDNFISGKAPFTVDFAAKTDSEAAAVIDFQWDFDSDGTIDSVDKSPTHTFTKTGTYTTTLTITDVDEETYTDKIRIIVEKQDLEARISANPIQGTSPLTVEFDASASTYPDGQITSYEWDFGDGTPTRIDAAKVAYKYTKIGTFVAKVTAIGSDNKRGTAQISINVRPVALKSCFTASRTKGTAPLTVIFDPRCSEGTIASYSWDFDDGEKTRDRKPTHTFTVPGSYEVTLEVADNQNVINTYTQQITVEESSE